MINIKINEIKIIKEDTGYYEPQIKLLPTNVKVNNIDIEYAISNNLNGNIIMFKENPVEGDLLNISFDTKLKQVQKIFTRSRYANKALLQLYSEDTKLKLNCDYKFHLEFKNNKFESYFTSKLDPFYSTVNMIRTDTGSLLENVSDSTISSVIYDNSLAVLDILDDTVDDVFEDGIPLYVKNYTRYKTDLDLCYSIYLSKTGKYGTYKKKLADLEVSNDYKVSDLNDMLSRFKELLKPNESLLNKNSSDFTTSFVKAKKTEYPVTNRGVF